MPPGESKQIESSERHAKAAAPTIVNYLPQKFLATPFGACFSPNLSICANVCICTLFLLYYGDTYLIHISFDLAAGLVVVGLCFGSAFCILYLCLRIWVSSKELTIFRNWQMP